MAMIPIASKFNFYQQIRLLLRKLRDGKTSDNVLLDEKLHITSPLSLDAPNGQVESLAQETPESPLQVCTGYNGLTGAMGALPTVYTEWLIERQHRYSDRSAKAFLDIFGHRLHSLDYLAWQKHHFYAQAEAQHQPPLQQTILALGGLLVSEIAASQAQHAAIFASPVRSMVNLERWLHQYFAVPVEIVPFTGGWRDVPAEECCQLGNPAQTLATAPMMGNMRREVNAHFDVILGPMSPETSRRFTPRGSQWREVWSSIRQYVGPIMDFSVSISISSAELTSRPLGMSAIGQDFCLGLNRDLHLHLVRIPDPTV
ncbi:type VI secretion system baseplate subunit TssG [Enterobacter sp. Cy-643]|uniref:type VI secretion system baseplate subunit TssG n=1 Tax=Enterobacter sp. Cy-643 TaxID=2608346 RepID=UPI00141FC9AB|nr:type VI secretion system baseplate subunit TssG [Enterobacter sp. Cy-643]NIF32446.1 type VI secretion system baseplate subunit TssG [Enterobacter sp. Cy-643]